MKDETHAQVRWKIDECALYFERLKIRGWCYHAEKTIARVQLRVDQTGEFFTLDSFGVMSSPDIAGIFGARAERVRFDQWIEGSPAFGTPFSLVFEFSDGSKEVGTDGLTNAALGDPYFQSWENFIESLAPLKSGAVLEIGSRARSAVSRKHRIPSCLEYVGLDILDGPNVDVVGDAHELSTIFPHRKFVAAFSASVFEHLIMPWKVALELNHVLTPGGLVYTSTHQTWPMHEEPWDFWRFSKHSWRGIFNPTTGFDLIEAVVGEPARVHSCRTSESTKGLPDSPCFLGSACLARKVSGVRAQWPVPNLGGIGDMYPAGELTVPISLDRT